MNLGPERRGPERPGPDYPSEWDREPSTVRTVIDPIVLVPICEECDGTGGWTETVEGQNGHDVDLDFTCRECSGTGQAE